MSAEALFDPVPAGLHPGTEGRSVRRAGVAAVVLAGRGEHVVTGHRECRLVRLEAEELAALPRHDVRALLLEILGAGLLELVRRLALPLGFGLTIRRQLAEVGRQALLFPALARLRNASQLLNLILAGHGRFGAGGCGEPSTAKQSDCGHASDRRHAGSRKSACAVERPTRRYRR